MATKIRSYEEISDFGKDIIKEVGSIGMGNAATAISGIMNTTVSVELPDVKLIDFNDAAYHIGEPEEAVMAVMAELSGEIEGVILFVFQLEFGRAIVKSMLGESLGTYSELSEMGFSALTEVGNIVISSYVNALAGITDMDVKISVPLGTVNMLGGVLNVPMVEVGYDTDKLLMVTGRFVLEGEQHKDCLLMIPSIQSLGTILGKLGS